MAGAVLSLALVAGLSAFLPIMVHVLLWLTLYFLYLSIVNVGQTFYGFGWEMLLCEALWLAVLAIFSIMWRWNDFLWPLIVLSRNEQFTLQLALNAFQGDLVTQWHYLLAMTVITLLPITLVFAFLQKYIATGIATTGLK